MGNLKNIEIGNLSDPKLPYDYNNREHGTVPLDASRPPFQWVSEVAYKNIHRIVTRGYDTDRTGRARLWPGGHPFHRFPGQDFHLGGGKNVKLHFNSFPRRWSFHARHHVPVGGQIENLPDPGLRQFHPRLRKCLWGLFGIRRHAQRIPGEVSKRRFVPIADGRNSCAGTYFW